MILHPNIKNMKIIFFIILSLFSQLAMADWVNLNTGINDDLTGVVFKGDYGLASGKAGLYYTTNGGMGPDSWYRFNYSGNTQDSIIYNNTRFTHCYSDRHIEENRVYACGKDTVNNTYIIMQVIFPSLNFSIIHIGPSNSALNKIDFNNGNDKYYAVGDHGLIINFTPFSVTILDSIMPYDLYSIDFFLNEFWIAADSVNILGEHNLNGFNYTITPSDSNCYKDVTYGYGYSAFGVGKAYYKLSIDIISEYTEYDFGSLNGRGIIYHNGYIFVGTDHGIFRPVWNSGSYILEWQPSSMTYAINEFWSENNSTFLYACGDNGVLLKTDALGGATKPYTKLTLEGGCEGSYIEMSAITGSSTTCKWYINNEYVHLGCNNFTYLFNSTGTYPVELQVLNDDGERDTATQEITVSIIPDINKPVTISDNMLCHKEVINITIDSSQNEVYYRLMKFGDNNEYGHSDSGNGGSISFMSDSLNTAGNYYIQAMNSTALCFNNFTDILSIDVEQTHAQFHVGKSNVIPGEEVNFYQNCAEAENYQWLFSDNAHIQVSDIPDVVNYFTNTDSTYIKLICWSDHACYDSLVDIGPTIYTKPSEPDSCWTNVDDSNDPPWSGYYTHDIAHLAKSQNGYLTCGYYHDMTFATQFGSRIEMNDKSGGYMMKHNTEGVAKWMVQTVQTSNTRETVKYAVEDHSGNIYIGGYANTIFIDNQGDTTFIGTGYPPHWGYIVKLDSLGRKQWILTGNDFTPTKLIIDYSDNLIVAASTSSSNIPILLNAIVIDTIAKIAPSCNYSIMKIQPEGNIVWDAGVEINAINGHEITKIGVDTLNRIYFTGIYEQNVTFYSANSNIEHYLAGLGNYGGKLFLANYDGDGLFQWSILSYTEGHPNDVTIPMDMVTDKAGNCYISGRNNCTNYTYSQKFISPHGSITSANVGEYYIAKINSEGDCMWIQGNSNSYYGFGHNVTLCNNTISVLGQVKNNEGTPESTSFTSSDGSTIEMIIQPWDYFIAVYDTSGSLLKMITNGNNSNGVLDYGFTGLFTKDNEEYYSARNMRFYNGCSNYNNFGTIIDDLSEIDGVVTKFTGSCGLVFYPSPVGINSKEPKLVTICPNPTHDQLKVNSDQKINKIEIIDINGQRLKVINTNFEKIDLHNINTGMYFIKIIFESTTTIQKIIKH